MKITKPTFAAIVMVLASAHSFAIEGLKIGIRCPDVVLSWPSVNNETYIVQYRPDLNLGTAWTTLTNSLPAATDTNWTSFVHSNRVQCAPGQTFGMSMVAGGGGDAQQSLQSAAAGARLTE